jgi:hypothetical protein
MRRTLSTLGALGAVAVLGLAAPARAQQKITVAIFAPNAAFESGDTRYAFISKLAQQVQTTTSITTEPKAYARSGDFEGAIKRSQVDFAVVDGVYLAERGVPYPVLAITTTGGETQSRWALYSSDGGGIMDQQGKRLALAATSAKDAQFIDNALLDSELPKHFGSRQNAPDIASAVAAVSLHKAQCVFAPEGLGKGLRKVFDAGRLPNPVFVQVNPGLSGDLAIKVKQAVLATAGGGPYDGWRPGSSEPYRSLASRLSPKVRRPIMAEPEVVRLDDTNVLVPPPLAPVAPDLKDLFWSPTGTP